MNNKRASFNLDETIDIALVENVSRNSELVNYKDLEKVASESGFVKRLPKKRKNRRKRSPYTEQLGIKIRPLIKEIFQEIGEKLSIYDHTTFELAILALIEKENDQELIKKYKTATLKTMLDIL
jgi:hypothetical protein